MKKLFFTIMLAMAVIFAPIVAKAEAMLTAAVASVKLHVKAIGLIAHAHLFNFMARSGMVLGANTLTNLVPTIYESLDIVSREMVGFIPAVSRNSNGIERAALNQLITVPVTQAQAMADNTPAVTAPNTGDQVLTNVGITISKSKHVPIRWAGEEQRGQLNAGTFQGTLKNQFSQAFRTLINQIEVDLFTTAFQNASRAYGTPGTAPFGTAGDLSDLAQVRKILDDNGVPQTDLHCVLGSSAVANLRGKQSLLLKVNESGSTALLRGGSITDLPIEGFGMHNSAGITAQTKGTGASYTSSTAGFAAGSTTIALITGNGTILAGDTITFAGDSNKYVVTTGLAAPGNVVIAAPGLLQALPASAQAVTVGANNTPNIAFQRQAIQLVTRLPATPIGPNGKPMDMASDSVIVTDPVSGISFEVAVYTGFLQMTYHVRLAWGYQAIKSNHIAVLQG